MRVVASFAFALNLLSCTTIPGSNISGNTFVLPTGLAKEAPGLEATLIKLTPQIVSSLTPKSLATAPTWNQSEGPCPWESLPQLSFHSSPTLVDAPLGQLPTAEP